MPTATTSGDKDDPLLARDTFVRRSKPLHGREVKPIVIGAMPYEPS